MNEALSNIQARAAGGPARAGRTYLVGERGMELFTPSVDGFVHNARDTAGMMRGGGGNRISYAPVINVSVNGGPNLSPRDIAQAINKELGRSLRELEAGAFRDGVYA